MYQNKAEPPLLPFLPPSVHSALSNGDAPTFSGIQVLPSPSELTVTPAALIHLSKTKQAKSSVK